MKQFTKLLASLALLIFMVAFIGCDNPSSSDNNTDNNTDTKTEEQSGIVSFAGIYEGSITGNGTTLYVTVVATANSYTTKMWATSEKNGVPDQTVTGTYTVTGNTINCTGSDHTMTETTSDSGTTWSIIVSPGEDKEFTGTITKTGSNS